MIVVDKLPADAVTFWFDKNQPRKNEGKRAAIERWKNWKRDHGEALARTRGNPRSKKDKLREMYHSIHHISGERSDGSPENLFVCESEKQHEHLELQLKQAQIELVKSKILGFDFGSKKYFVAWQPLADKLKEWRNSWHKDLTVDQKLIG